MSDPNAVLAPPLYSVWMFDPAQNTLLPVLTPTEDVMITDVVAAQPRTLPAVILDQVIALGQHRLLARSSEGVGVLSIKSVYDFDGTDTATPNIATVRNPTRHAGGQPPGALHPYRKGGLAGRIGTCATSTTRRSASPASCSEILGYAPIEPDGSVKIKVPANVAFQFSILDANGRRIGPIHGNWLQLRPGETRECNGCHNPPTQQNPRSHGRTGLFNSVNSGRADDGPAVPGHRSRPSRPTRAKRWRRPARGRAARAARPVAPT